MNFCYHKLIISIKQHIMQSAKWFSTPVVIALIVGIILGFAIGNYTQRGKGGVAVDEALDDDTAAPEVVVAGAELEGDAVAVSTVDQPAGKIVLVSNVTLDKTAWLAVQNYSDGQLSNVLGAHRLAAGNYASDIIDLVIPTVADKTYAITVFYDEGDLNFSRKNDIPVLKSGSPIFATFVAE